MKEYFINLLNLSEIKMDEDKIDNMLSYLYLLAGKNKVMNLTAIRDEKDMLEKHFIDALLLTKVIKDDEKTFIDLGTGAGFPGLVLAIFYPEKQFLLVDSVKKKVAFLDEVIEKLNLKNVKTSTERAEEIIKKYREKFDVALCRGVANLRIILEYMIPFLKVNGRFLPQKLNLNELEESNNALNVLHSSIDNIHKFNLPISKDERIVLEISKNKKTPSMYPRAVGIPSKKPI
ncbi:16S rRNA (guanine(527)-N(7))-methyltransferase RsmG [Streptobacillus felis]|uniref:Ribosomal RNA small subunit methyltransferase G n=1 Tax=Streptobacillus felis TaxID=1384509 RepID=A0A7Z0PE17_9FUSO|nr:16S rRNA (guanine(527)-N(7))-methyltransferase RsmG [Streptobacillus felis]NYV27553.1 16S rRNA (guanine(527)-N(7))-methyltransferase RsmG [Streptobacillus felis]